MKKTILVNTLIIFVFLIALEISCSIIFYIKDVKNPLILSESIVDFPYVYYTFMPEKKDGLAIVNNDGLYTRYDRKKPDNTTRIALLGGSTARGMLASNTIGDVLEKLLQKEFPDKRIEVINAGMSGYVAEQLFIFYQLVLSKYNPDLVVGLNGYNDLMSVKLNRHSGVYFSPQNMQQFRVIEEGKNRKTLVGRVKNIFPNTARMVNFIKRQALGPSQYDYSKFNDTQIDEAAKAYIDIIRDIHFFCNVNGTIHIEFLQPVRWYVEGDIEKSTEKGGVLPLVKLYSSYEKRLTELRYAYSLTDLFNKNEGLFKDDCHVSDIGNEMIALRLLEPIKKELIHKLKNKKYAE